MSLSRIKTVEDLHTYLYAAQQLEHATLPAYLTALYSIHPGTNSDAYHVIRVVLVEEMLHLTLAANILNAIGGQVNLAKPGFLPEYPTYLPNGEEDFEVGLGPFSPETIDAFLSIERPATSPSEEMRVFRRERVKPSILAALMSGDDADLHFYSIGEFYAEIARGLEYVESEMRKAGKELFVGDPSWQITPEYYYSGGGEVIPVTDLASAKEAIRLISEQGEGLEGGIYDHENELSHYYRFQQIKLGRYYMPGDQPNKPTGHRFEVDWDAVYPVKRNPRVADYPEGSELRSAAEQFNGVYLGLLGYLTQAYSGRPDLLIPAVGEMFRIKERAYQLIRNPLPGAEGVNAGPTFELYPKA